MYKLTFTMSMLVILFKYLTYKINCKALLVNLLDAISLKIEKYLQAILLFACMR